MTRLNWVLKPGEDKCRTLPDWVIELAARAAASCAASAAATLTAPSLSHHPESGDVACSPAYTGYRVLNWIGNPGSRHLLGVQN